MDHDLYRTFPKLCLATKVPQRSFPWFCTASVSIITSFLASWFFDPLTNYNTEKVISMNDMPVNPFDLRSTVLVLALILVPIAVLFCILAVALACSEFWSTHRWWIFKFWKRANTQQLDISSNHHRTSTSTMNTMNTNSTNTNLEYQEPREYV